MKIHYVFYLKNMVMIFKIEPMFQLQTVSSDKYDF